MKVTEVSIDKVILAEKSVRMHTEIQVKEFARSLEMFGQIRPIVVDGKYNIVCGNGLYLAAQSLGWAKVKVLVMNNLIIALTSWQMMKALFALTVQSGIYGFAFLLHLLSGRTRC